MSQPDNAGEGQAHNALTPSGGMDTPSRMNTPSRMDNPGRNDNPNQNGFSPNRGKNAGDDTDRASKWDRGSAQGINGNSDDVVQNRVVIKMASGQSAQFDVDSRMAAAIKARGDHKALIFYSSDGKDVTSVSAIGERCHGQVVGTSGNSILFRTDDGQTRILSFGAAGAKLHLRAGSKISVETEDATHARVISDDLLKKHAFDKFDKRATADVDAKAKKAKKADVDVADAKAKKAKKRDTDLADNTQDTSTKSKCGASSGRRGGRAFANQMAKDAANDASGHNPPGLPHECVNPAGHTRGFCKSGESSVDCSGSSSTDNDVAMDSGSSSSKGKCGESASSRHGRAYANQMAKDAANDASGHNPPGLPHECVNPAGHVRGFCKSGSSEVDCSGSGTENDVAADTGGSTSKGKCGESASASSRHGRAYANQMAKDAANDASGHNPPGLPHECINPAGHTRGWCKSGSTESDVSCTSAVAAQSSPSVANKPGTSPVVGGGANAPAGPAVVAGGANAASPAVVAGPHAVNVPGFASTPLGGPGMVVGPSTGTGYVGPAAAATAPKSIAAVPVRAKHPTRVMGAAVGPESIQLVPLSKTPCVWHRTAVMGAAVGPSQRVGRLYASGSHVHRHTNCR